MNIFKKIELKGWLIIMDEVFDKIKEQAYKAKDGAVKLGRSVLGKTNNLVGQTKLKFAIGETEDKIKAVYTQIGEDIYTSYCEGTEISGLDDQCAKIDDLHAELADLKNQLAELRETVKCPSCGSYNNKENVYCAKCGSKITDDAAAAEEDFVETAEAEEAPEEE